MSKVIFNQDAAPVAKLEGPRARAVQDLLDSCDALAAAKFAVYAARQCPVKPDRAMSAIEAFLTFPTRAGMSEVAVKLESLMMLDEEAQPSVLCWASKATAQAALAVLTYSLDKGTSAPLAREYALGAYRFTLKSVESAAMESTVQVPPGYVYGTGPAARVRLAMSAAEARLMAELNKLAHPKLAAADLPAKREE
jgi:hypothetical protein